MKYNFWWEGFLFDFAFSRFYPKCSTKQFLKIGNFAILAEVTFMKLDLDFLAELSSLGKVFNRPSS